MSSEQLTSLRMLLGNLPSHHRAILASLIQGEELTPEESAIVSYEEPLRRLLKGFCMLLVDEAWKEAELRREISTG